MHARPKKSRGNDNCEETVCGVCVLRSGCVWFFSPTTRMIRSSPTPIRKMNPFTTEIGMDNIYFDGNDASILHYFKFGTYHS
jgi:hypothetical protein